MEKASDKKWSWVLVMLQLWQQWNAFKIIRKIYKKDDCAEDEKKRMLKELSSIEPFFESVPSILIMTCIWSHVGSNEPLTSLLVYYDDPTHYYHFNCSNPQHAYIPINDLENFCAVFDGFGGPSWFFTTYTVSILAGCFGICKFLQNGPVAILPSNMMNWTLVRAFFAVMFSLAAKGLLAGIVVTFVGTPKGDYDESTQFWIFPLIFTTLNILPNLIVSVIGISLKTGWNKKLIRALLDYPALMALPAFTNFAVGPPHLPCSRVNENSEQDLTVSRRLTAINTGLTVICNGITLGILSQLVNSQIVIYEFPNYYGAFAPVSVMSCLSIIVFYFFDSRCCVSSS